MKKSGIAGYIRLLIAVIIIIIVAVSGVSHVRKIFKEEDVKNFESDLLLVQAKTELTKGNYIMDKDNHPLRGIQLSQLPEEINLQDIFDKGLITEEEKEKYYYLDDFALEQIGLQGLYNRYDGKFIVNYDSYEVIYTKGYENENGLWCYKVSELNKEETPINIDELNKEETTEEAPAEETKTEEQPVEEAKIEEQPAEENVLKGSNETYKKFKEDAKYSLQTVKDKIAEERNAQEAAENVTENAEQE